MHLLVDSTHWNLALGNGGNFYRPLCNYDTKNFITFVFHRQGFWQLAASKRPLN